MAITTTQRKRTKTLIAELRSGKYKQCMVRLKSEDAFCAAGVACEVYRKVSKSKYAKWEGEAFISKDLYKNIPVSTFHQMPLIVNNYYGMGFSAENEMMAMNERGVTFPKIAEWLEKKLEEGTFDI